MRRPKAGKGPSPALDIARRKEIIREDLIELRTQDWIVVNRARQWNLTREAINAYLHEILAEIRSAHEARLPYLRDHMVEAMAANYRRSMEDERSARGEKNWLAANQIRKTQLIGLERISDVCELSVERHEHLLRHDGAIASPKDLRIGIASLFGALPAEERDEYFTAPPAHSNGVTNGGHASNGSQHHDE